MRLMPRGPHEVRFLLPFPHVTRLAQLAHFVCASLLVPFGVLACGGSDDDGTIDQQVAGNGGGGGAPTSGGTQSGGSQSAGSGGALSAGTGGGAAQCPSGCPLICEGGLCDCFCPPSTPSCEDFSAPDLDKSCTTDADCFAGVHYADCCGSQVVLGYSTEAEAAFITYEADCASRALCRCAPSPPMLEGGQVTSDVDQAIGLCGGGQCYGSGPVNTGGP